MSVTHLLYSPLPSPSLTEDFLAREYAEGYKKIKEICGARAIAVKKAYEVFENFKEKDLIPKSLPEPLVITHSKKLNAIFLSFALCAQAKGKGCCIPNFKKRGREVLGFNSQGELKYRVEAFGQEPLDLEEIKSLMGGISFPTDSPKNITYFSRFYSLILLSIPAH